jgi:rod shape determining protein RodA
MSRRTSLIGNLDWWLVVTYFFLVFFGWLNIYSSTNTEEFRSIFDFTVEQGKQFIWICISLGMIILLLILDSKVFPAFSPHIYGMSIVLLVLVLFIGQTVAGNQSWIVVNSFIKIQPSEFAKYATALAVSYVISAQEFSFKKSKYAMLVFGMTLCLPD